MNEVRLLTILELRGLYGINRFLHTRDKKQRRRAVWMGVAWAMVIAVVFFYVGGLSWGLCALGLSAIVPTYLTLIASVLIVAFGLYRAGHVIFARSGYEQLRALPLKPGSIVLSRFLTMYLEDLLLTVIVLLPGAVVLGVMMRPGLLFYLRLIVGAVFIPAIPLTIATAFGTLLYAVSSRMKHKSLVQTALAVALVVLVLLGSFSFGNTAEHLTPELLADLAQTVNGLISRIYPPANWLFSGLLGFLAFCFVSILAMATCMLVTVRLFSRIMQALGTGAAKQDYRMGTLQSGSLRKALYVREAKRYFSSTVYVTNTIIGPIMGTILAGAACFAGLDTVQAAIPIELDLTTLLPLAVAAVFCMMTTTSASISMEGSGIWQVQSLPIPAKALFDSKILLNLSLMAPFYVVSEVFLFFALRPVVLDALWLIFAPALLMCFSVVLGITVDLKFHRFDWEREEQVVKQGMSAFLGGFAGFLLSAALLVGLLLLPKAYGFYAKIAVCAVLCVGTWFLYGANNKVQLRRL